jgi:diguanylate cyclase (GGDEF)-like protein
VAEATNEQIAGEAYPALLTAGTAWFGFTESDIEGLFVEIQRDAAAITALFDVPESARPSPAETLRRAHAALAELSLRSAEEQVRWRQEAEMLADEVATDTLTGVASRRALNSRLSREIDTARSAGGALGVLMVDIDYFKKINDVYGHQIGDEVLRALANTLQRGVRPRDMVARLGGDEFVVLLPESSIRASRFVAERLRLAVEKIDLRDEDASRVRINVSIGVTEYSAYSADGPADLLAQADRALYLAKAAGRNRVARVPARLPRPQAA